VGTVENLTRETSDGFAAGDEVSVKGIGFTPSTRIAVVGQRGAVLISPKEVSSSSLNFVWPDGISAGEVLIKAVEGGKESLPVRVRALGERTPYLKSAIYEGGLIVLEGGNFSQSMTLFFEEGGFTAQARADAGSITRATANPPAGAKSSSVYLKTALGSSNPVYLQLLQNSISGKVYMPKGSSLLPSQLEVSYAPGESVSVDASGAFSGVPADAGRPVTLTVALDGLAYMSAIAVPGEGYVEVSPKSTVVAMAWAGLDLSRAVESADWARAREVLEGVQEVEEAASYLEGKLASDSEYLADGSTEDKTFVARMDLVYEKGWKALEAQNLIRSQALEPQQVSAIIIPRSQHGISLSDKDGNMTLYNKTRLNVSTKMTSKEGVVLQDHVKGYTDEAMVGGAYGIWYARWRSTQTYDQPQYRDCTVEVITSGAASPRPSDQKGLSVWKALILRTLIADMVSPIMSSVFDFIPASDLIGAILDNAPDVAQRMVDAVGRGSVKEALMIVIDVLYNDLKGSLKDVDNPKPITRWLINKYGQSIGKKITEKLGKEFISRFVPILGQLKMASNLYSFGGVAATLNDCANTPGVMEFDVDFPLEVTGVSPSRLVVDGSNKRVLVKGYGFKPITVGLIPKTTVYPRVTFRDEGWGIDEVTVKPDPTGIKSDGTAMVVEIPASFLGHPSGNPSPALKGPLSLTVEHGPNYEARVELKSAIELVPDFYITGVSPAKAKPGDRVSIFTTGAATGVRNNRVTIGGNKAYVTFAAYGTVDAVVPTRITQSGTYPVEVETFRDGKWEKAKNAGQLEVEVELGNVTITVLDNGGDKDDAFALYVDGKYIFTLYASPSSYSRSAALQLTPGRHTVTLVGVEAPEAVGTYEIRFQGATVVGGDPLEGEDLTPGVVKTFYIEVGASSQSIRPTVEAFPVRSRTKEEAPAR